MAILYIRDQDGNFVPIPSINGVDGKSAYEYAKEGGYKGTEQEFIAILNGLTGSTDARHYTDFGNPHKVTAGQVGSLKFYNGFGALNEEIGTSFDSDTPIETIIQAMPDNTGLKADINTVDAGDSGTTIYPAVYGILSIYKIRNNRVEVEYVSNVASGGKEYNQRWIGQYNVGKFGGFVQIYTEQNKPKASDVGALPTSGGELTGPIKWNDGQTHIIGQADGNFIIQNYKTDEDGNDDFIAFHNRLALENALKFYRNGKSYSIFGEHNRAWLGNAKIEKGTYTGAGVYGADKPNSLTFDFIPKMVFIHCVDVADNYGIFAYGASLGSVFYSGVSGLAKTYLTWNEKTVSWYSTDSSYSKERGQLNASGKEYIYVAIG